MFDSNKEPVWDPDIKTLFVQPPWLDPNEAQIVGADWIAKMTDFGIQLDHYDSVKQWSVTIYYHLHSRNMPLTTNEAHFFPPEALELVRRWINQGCRRTNNELIVVDEKIPATVTQPPKVRVRKNILDLTEEELNTFRMKLDDLQIGDPSPDSPWQKLAYVHTNWCLHYQEAFLLWHRAFLLYFENLIDFPIPYWNWTSPDASRPGNPESGLPQPYVDETYVHPRTGEIRPNPLRYAAAKDGKSKACSIPSNPCCQDNPAEEPHDCMFVQRDPILYTKGDGKERTKKLKNLEIYKQQILHALTMDVFSVPQGYPGIPWANIPTFNPPPEPSAYPNRTDFDGLYEQPHDNVHGWVGPDMADNAYTAFDPVFWGHHSNLDRIFEVWKRDHPAAQYTPNFPLQPFVGPIASELELASPIRYLYTTIGDMTKDCRALGYDYLPPQSHDLAMAEKKSNDVHLFVVFEGVRCTHDTYQIEIFLDQDGASLNDANFDNPHYAGQMTRCGMGVADNKGRCIKHSVTRVFDVTSTADKLELQPDTEQLPSVSLVVFDVTKEVVVPRQEYESLPGFAPKLEWRKPGQGNRKARSVMLNPERRPAR